MKSTVHLLLSVGLLLGLCNCGGSKRQQKPTKKVAHINMPVIGNKSETLAFNEDIESFILEENNDFGSFASSDLDDSSLLALNDPNNISFSWDAIEADAQNTFQTVYFGYDNSRISQKEKPKIAKNAKHAKEATQQGKTVICKGKACKWGGTEVYNLALSDQRAQSVARELKSAGIPQDHIKAFGVGTKESIAMGNHKEDHALDRCVEVYSLTI